MLGIVAMLGIAAQTRSPVIFENGRAQFTSHARAAAWWQTEIERRFAAET